MRRNVWLVVFVVALLVGFVPMVQAQVPLFGGNSWSFPIYLETNTDIPAGRITIYFSDTERGVPQYVYLGSSKNIVVPSGNSAFRWCIARVDLTGRYADERVDCDWGHRLGTDTGKNICNAFASEVSVGEQEAVFTIYGKKKTHLRILFFSVEIGSKTVSMEDGFRVFVQSDEGLTDYKGQLEIAQAAWPSLCPADRELWARTWTFDKRYLAQGLIPTGTVSVPVVSTETLKDLFSLRQQKADEAWIRQERQERERAEAEVKAKAEAEAMARAQAEEAARQEAVRLAAEEAARRQSVDADAEIKRQRAESERELALARERQAQQEDQQQPQPKPQVEQFWTLTLSVPHVGLAISTRCGNATNGPYILTGNVITLRGGPGTYYVSIHPRVRQPQTWLPVNVTSRATRFNYDGRTVKEAPTCAH